MPRPEKYSEKSLFYIFILVFFVEFIDRIFLLTLLSITSLIAIFSVSAIISNPILAQKSMQTYENEKYGFKIQYPFNWEFEESNYLDNTQETIGGFSLISSIGVSFVMSIQFLPSDNILTLDQYAEQQLQKIKNYKLSKDIHFNKLLSFDKSYTLGGKPAYKIVYDNEYSLFDRVIHNTFRLERS